ncbi:hypothetical protein [Paraburkholderia caribensis]|jgi:hypothetical protein|uniref:Uncharacterized protein n=1 Tax=Paraburkholderia caribensis TaxID=75105 RepID=A0A9Q6S8E9_9BURK|nr:hypothetical protein [Paraburkholderia caribensis]ALP67012.1 hypothetical protein AN416_30285 [Paraburkholderia caribensis]AMV47575.1 hypothetical protein ATN79_43660 [Paraburkholderia caribensis]AUT56714.1 hypothetical protein C2L66_33205 [Paraburkholderia caribensis]MCO4878726.1 hypothetical protein [Paraburkholderia caribensis]MDR6382520.1 hypothetical protein [Paraburkholderia caribensis]
MAWLVILHGAYWRNVSHDVFSEHPREDDWSQLACDTFDASEGMCEAEVDGLKILIPRNTVIAAVNLQDREQAKGFALPVRDGQAHR